jgi:protease I
MAKIGILITDMFEDIEYTKPAEEFQKVGHELVHISTESGKTIKGKHGAEVKIDEKIDDMEVSDLEALFIPGGFSPDQLRVNDKVVKFVADYAKTNRPMLIICHGPQLLITADVIKGRKVTGWKSIMQDIKNAGAEYIDKEVVVDKNIVSSRGPDDIPAFVRESLKKLEEVYGKTGSAQDEKPTAEESA